MLFKNIPYWSLSLQRIERNRANPIQVNRPPDHRIGPGVGPWQTLELPAAEKPLIPWDFLSPGLFPGTFQVLFHPLTRCLVL